MFFIHQIINTMKNDNLIIQLIQQDLKHNKLVKGLFQLGLDDESFYYLEIFTIVQQLMNIQSDELADTFSDVYCCFMHEVFDIDLLELDDKIPSIANQCYQMLKSLVEIETRVNPKL